MQEKSRVKKYEEVRQGLATDEHDDIDSDTRLRVIQHITKNQANTEVQTKPIHEVDDIPTQQRDVAVEAIMNDPMSENQNEYLDDFLQEVKDYNIEKGNRDNANTQINILRQLTKKSERQRKQYLEDIEENDLMSDEGEIYTSTLSSEEIAEQVQAFVTQKLPIIEDEIEEEEEHIKKKKSFASLLRSNLLEDVEDTSEIEVPETMELEEPEKTIVIQKHVAVMDAETTQALQKQQLLQEQLLEETQHLRKQVEEYEEELTHLSTGVSKANRVLNIVLTFFILILVGVIAYFTYLIINGGGL